MFEMVQEQARAHRSPRTKRGPPAVVFGTTTEELTVRARSEWC
jgi:hypothetical protein